jgi:outer membrane protein OmpA-like peptidoglycan-associated protein
MLSARALCIGLCLLGTLPLTSTAQNRRGIGISFGAYDFYGPQTNHYLFNDKMRLSYDEQKDGPDMPGIDSGYHKALLWQPMGKISYWQEFGPHFDGTISLSLGFVDQPKSNDDSSYVMRTRDNVSEAKNEKFLGHLDARFHYNILDKNRWIFAPYVLAGIAGDYHDVFFGANLPLGLGVNINLNKAKTLNLNLESAYRIAATSHDVNHLEHTLGFVYWFQKGYKKPVHELATVAPPPPPDRDNDGLTDDEDQCPDLPGPANLDGCPDSDGDHISDKNDACPLVPGLAQFNGCPDSDGDGIPDNKDRCPYQAGTADNQGCAPADRDNDGVSDAEDRCPDVAGPASNQGCPEIRKEVLLQVDKAAKAVFFETGKSTLKKISYKPLDEVAKILKEDPSLYADIEGHTDNVQPKTYTNMELSQKRADAVRDYLVSKGVDASRLTSQGFGETKPVASNDSPAGRAQNRRTVIKLRNYK